jgi:uncharacterized protein (DUF1330 family)
MAKGYWITTYKSISDMRKVEAYAKLAGPAIEAQGGVYLARSVATMAYEAWPQRTHRADSFSEC